MENWSQNKAFALTIQTPISYAKFASAKEESFAHEHGNEHGAR